MAEMLAGLAASLSSIDGVVHVTRVRTWEGSFAGSVTTEAWVDGRRQVARSVWTAAGERHDQVVTGGVQYSWPSGLPNRPAMELPSCLGAPALVRVLVECPSGQLTQPYTLERETIDGREAITLVSRQIIEPREVDVRESFDAVTLLPVRSTEVSVPGLEAFRSTTTWTSEVVAATSLADGFFTPEAIGVVFPSAAEVMSAIPSTTPVYWVGETYSGAGGALAVSAAEWSGVAAMVSYGTSDRPYAMPPALRIDTSPVDGATPMVNMVPPCPGAGESRIGAATVVVRCPADVAGRVIVELSYPDAVVMIESPYRCEGDTCTLGRFNDADTLLAIARDLVRR